MMNKQEFVPRPLRKEPLYHLESVNDIPSSDLYAVKVNGKEHRVYHTEFFDLISFVDETGTSDIEVEIRETFEKLTVRPRSADIKYELKGSTVTLRMKAGERAVLELDDRLEAPLYIFSEKYVERPEKVDYEFKSGKAYNIGCLELSSDETVYIEEGAVVSGRIYSRMADNVKILGNGILYGGNWHKWDENGAEQTIVTVLGKNIEIRGITLMDGGSWHLVPVACQNVTIEDVNILGNVITGDGIDVVGCEDVIIRNCFVRANDDCISIKGCDYQDPSGCTAIRRVRVENCIFWNAEFGNALEIGYETRGSEITDVVFKDCDIIHCQYEGNQSGGVLTIHNADRAHVHHIYYENIRIEDAQEKFIDIKTLDSKYSTDRERGMISDIYFKNIEITGGGFPVSIIRGFEMKNELCRPHGFHFENVVIHGKKICSANELRMVVELANDLEFC